MVHANTGMSSMNSLFSTCSLNGHSIRLLGLSPETEAQLHRLGIFTLEQLARLAINRSGVDECMAVEAIQKELTARLAPRTVSCFSTGGFAAHFIIDAESLFFFKASVIPDDQESWTCSYQWYVQEERDGFSDDLMFFHDPLSVPNSSVSEHYDLTSPQIAHQSSASTHWETNEDDMKTEKWLQDASANYKVIQNPEPFPVTHPMKTAVEQQTPPFEDSYDVWNHAIATYVTAGAQRGSIVYLSIDDDVIDQIARRLTAQAGHPPTPFLEAVRRRVVKGRRVELKRIQGRNRYGEPNSIAFLAAMVLAASRMAEDEEGEIASSNYFTRFCEVLQLDQEGGRPLGMKAGADAEELLWREWTIWLGEHGLISSARPGEGAGRYINYPISQALLRGADRDRLYRLFRESKWGNDWDVDTVIAAARRAAPYLTKHLQRLLSDASQRAEAIAEAIYDAYESWASGEISGQTSNRSYRRYLSAGIWRSEDVLSGAVEYFLYPQSPRRQQFDEIIVHIDGREHALRAERPGWYMPLCPINGQQLNQGVRYAIKYPPQLEELVLPPRTFWILRPDPDNPESGVYASWGRASLGVPLMILCRRELIADLEKLRAERLIEWSDEPKDIPLFSEWVEVRYCMVISQTWDGVEIEHRDLHDALRPKERLSIGLSGGLRAPQGGWLVDMGPQITIFGFPPEADIRIVRLHDDQTIFEETRATNRPFEAVWQTPGDYLIEAVSGSSRSESLVKIIDWDHLKMASTRDFDWPRINDICLRGALLQTAENKGE